MRFKKFVFNDKLIVGDWKISKILESNDMNWLIDSQFEDADVEIKKNTVIWNSGNYYTGNWHYGIFRDGEFHGIFENGILEGGKFMGKFISGIRLDTQSK